MTNDETMELALQHYASGQLRETEGLCRKILHADPRHGAALHLLGVIALNTRHHEAAVDLIRAAIASHKGGMIPLLVRRSGYDFWAALRRR